MCNISFVLCIHFFGEDQKFPFLRTPKIESVLFV